MSTDGESDEEVFTFIDPSVEMNLGLWLLFGGATIFLALRLFFKTTRRHALWWDDYILLVCWTLLLANNTLICVEFATGYVLPDSTYEWDNRMRILITISSCGTLINQAWTKTAFGVTLLRMSNEWQKWILWFCITSMNIFMAIKVIAQWGKVCGEEDYDVSWRLDFCLDDQPRDDLKEGGNVYNIIMDFVFASFPWLITRSLKISRGEKIGLCATMSLGMVVAIVSAIRVGWKDNGNDRDRYYIYRNGLSQVWYSSEIAGTIMVQCIPILRPIVREIQTTRSASRRLDSMAYGESGKHTSATVDSKSEPTMTFDKYEGPQIELREIPEEAIESRSSRSSSQSSRMEPVERPGTAGTWLHSASEESGLDRSLHSNDPYERRPESVTSSAYGHDGSAPVRGFSLPRR